MKRTWIAALAAALVAGVAGAVPTASTSAAGTQGYLVVLAGTQGAGGFVTTGTQAAISTAVAAAGGTIAGAKGVDENQFQWAAKLGVTKINIDTDGRLVWTRVHREFFRDNPKEFDFRPPGKVFIEEYAKFIASRNVLLGSANQLDDLRKSLGK